MVNLYLFAVGGTGARCLETILYMAAAGLYVGQAETIRVLRIDPDEYNGNGKKATAVAERYGKLRSWLHDKRMEGAGDFLQTPVEISSWCPVPGIDDEKLRGLCYQNGTLDTEAEALLGLFYTKDEEKLSTLNKGYCAHPSIGATMMRAIQLQQSAKDEDPYTAFKRKIQADVNANLEVAVLVVGSLFGGTGASAFPMLARDVRSLGEQHIKLGAIMMLPYFSIEEPKRKVDQQIEKIDSKNFQPAAASALRYYCQYCENLFDVTYLFGSPIKLSVEYKETAGEQYNEPTIVDLEAAQGVHHFLLSSTASSEKPYIKGIVMEDEKLKYGWNDMQYGADKVRRLLYFSLFYVNSFMPEVYKSSKAKKAPLFFQRHIRTYDEGIQRELADVYQFCERLLWLFNRMHEHEFAQTSFAKKAQWAQLMENVTDGDVFAQGYLVSPEAIACQKVFVKSGKNVLEGNGGYQSVNAVYSIINEIAAEANRDVSSARLIHELYKSVMKEGKV